MKILFVVVSLVLISCSSDSDKPVEDVGTDASEDANNRNNEHDSGPDGTGAPLRERYSLSGSTLFPKGIEFDSVTRKFLLGSLTTGALTAVDVDGTESEFASPQRANWVTFGLAVDESARLVWVCARNTDLDSEDADALWIYNVDSGDAVSQIDLGTADPEARCNDIVLGSDGDAYITDPVNGRVYTTSSDGPPSTIVESAMLATANSGLGASGLVLTPDERTLVVGVYLPTDLVAIPLDTPEGLFSIRIDGDWVGPDELGSDGLVEYEGDVVVVSNSSVRRVSIDLDQQIGTSSLLEVQDSGLSTGVLAEGELYVVKSELVSFIIGQEPDLPFAIIRVPLGD